MSSLTNILYVLYLPALGALIAIVQLVRSKSVAVIAFATGLACVASFAALFIWRWVMVSAVTKAGNASAADLAKNSIHFGLASYLILLCGLALLGAALGFIRLPQKTA